MQGHHLYAGALGALAITGIQRHLIQEFLQHADFFTIAIFKGKTKSPLNCRQADTNSCRFSFSRQPALTPLLAVEFH